MANQERKPRAHDDADAQWKPSGIVTLLSDFGQVDPYVGMLKGVLFSVFPGVVPIDLTHGVPPQQVSVGAWLLSHAWPYFPAGTVHLAVVDPGVGSARRLLVAADHGHVFLGPDNGLLAACWSPSARVFELDVARFARQGTSATFHGRDILAPAAAAIAAGRAPRLCGTPLADGWVRAALPEIERLADGSIQAEVLFVDHYGNLILNARAADLGPGAQGWRVELAGHSLAIAATYAEVAPGELLALVDSYGALEIAVRDGDAAQRLRVRAGARVTMRKQR